MGPLDDAKLDACSHIVALLGPEPYIAALDGGADIVLGGRTTDTAVLAAAALRRGAHPGCRLASRAKTSRVRRPVHGEPRLSRRHDDASTARDSRSTRWSAANRVHAADRARRSMLYENAGPLPPDRARRRARCRHRRALRGDRRSSSVRVTGSRWETAYSTPLKLEGAGRRSVPDVHAGGHRGSGRAGRCRRLCGSEAAVRPRPPRRPHPGPGGGGDHRHLAAALWLERRLGPAAAAWRCAAAARYRPDVRRHGADLRRPWPPRRPRSATRSSSISRRPRRREPSRVTPFPSRRPRSSAARCSPSTSTTSWRWTARSN